MNKAYINWSGGKDCSLALYHMQRQKEYVVGKMLTCVNSVHNRVSMHGVRREMLEAQAAAIGISLTTIELPEEPAMEEYELMMRQQVNELKQQGFEHAIFGDIFLEDLRVYREEKLAAAGISAVFPLWKRDTTELVHEFITLGFKAIIVCVNEQWLDKSFCGRIIDQQFIDDLPANVDPCGENGEFHSYVFDGPIFESQIVFKKGEIVYKEYRAPSNGPAATYGFWFCDLINI